MGNDRAFGRLRSRANTSQRQKCLDQHLRMLRSADELGQLRYRISGFWADSLDGCASQVRRLWLFKSFLEQGYGLAALLDDCLKCMNRHRLIARGQGFL